MDNPLPRIGNFFVLVGGGLMIIFLGSEFGREPDFNYFFLGLGALCLGFLFRRRHAPPPESARFSTLRRMGGRNRRPPEDQDSGAGQPTEK
jgi:hypothetical protein